MDLDIRQDEIIVDGKFKPVIFVRELLAGNKKYFKTLTSQYAGETIWRFDEDKGIWIEDGVPFIETIIRDILGFKLNVNHFNQVLKIFRVYTYEPQEDFVDDPGSIALKNGEYDFHTGGLTEYQPYHNHRNRLPLNYDEEAECPAFKQFLKDVCPGDEDTVQELFGYLLVKGYPIQKCFIFQGSGANGKSTLLRVMESFLGAENCSSVGLFDLVVKTFSKAELYGKLANIAPDIGADELKKTGIFKALTGGDTITAERKNQHPFQFKNYAKMIFSCNQLPTSPDNSDAFFRRFMIFQFKRIFDDKTADKNILHRITCDDELSGIFNWALIGYHRLMQNMTFTESRSTKDTRELYMEMSDPVNAFVNAMVEEDPDAITVKNEIWRYYGEFCDQRGFITLAENRFFSELKKRVYVQDTQKTVNGARMRAWIGLRLKIPAHPAQDAQVLPSQQKFNFSTDPNIPVHPVQPVQLSEPKIVVSVPENVCERCGRPGGIRMHGVWMCQGCAIQASREEKSLE